MQRGKQMLKAIVSTLIMVMVQCCDKQQSEFIYFPGLLSG